MEIKALKKWLKRPENRNKLAKILVREINAKNNPKPPTYEERLIAKYLKHAEPDSKKKSKYLQTKDVALWLAKLEGVELYKISVVRLGKGLTAAKFIQKKSGGYKRYLISKRAKKA